MVCRTFENDVKMYGTQTGYTPFRHVPQFENDVKMYGTQTPIRPAKDLLRFENDVKTVSYTHLAEVLLKEDGSFEVIRRAETPKDYFATLDGTPEYEKMFGNK